MVVNKVRSVVRISHINLVSFRARRPQLIHLINEFRIDILTLNETKLIPGRPAQLPNFTIIRRDNRSNSGGIAIAHRSELDVQQVPLPNDPSQALLVTVNLPRQRPFYLATFYANPFSQEVADVLTHVASTYSPLIIAGDFNCHHTALGDNSTTATGRTFYRVLRQTGLHHFITPYTRYPTHANHNPTYPDKLLSTPNFWRKIINISSGFDIGSDHVPLIFDVKIIPYPYKMDDHPRIIINDFKNADWAKYDRVIQTKLVHLDVNHPPTAPDQVEALNQTISEAIIDAQSQSIPRKTVVSTQFRLPPHILALIKTKRRLRRLLLRDPHSPYLHDNYRYTVQRVKDEVRIFHENRMRKICDEADADIRHNPKAFWNLIRRYNHPKPQPTPLRIDGNIIADSEGISEAFRDHFQKVHQVPMNPSFYNNHFNGINNSIDRHQEYFRPYPTLPPDPPHHPLTEPISIAEIKLKLKGLRNTAPGPDGISNLILKHSPEYLLLLLGMLFNACLQLGYTPSSWKHAHVIVIQKPNKDPRNPGNYRPISLTSAISKLFEKILTRRLHAHLTGINAIPHTQAGFRPGINMNDQIMRVVTSLQTNVAKRQPTLLALMDVQKAFDTVWHNGLRAKLLYLQLPPAVIKWLSSFIDGRTAQIRHRGTLSTPFTIEAGVPQGSAISPLLYIIYVRDIPNPATRGPHDTSSGLAQFADDTAYWCSDRVLPRLRLRLSRMLSEYLEYCNKWRITINTDKTQICYFNFQGKHVNIMQETPLLLNGTPIPISKTCKYLGITLDYRLTFVPHFLNLKKQASSRIKALAILNFRHQGCSTPTLTRIYTSIIRPILTYAHPLLLSIHESHILSFEQTERRALRLAHHLPRDYPNQLLYDTMNIPTLRDFTNKLNSTYIAKAGESPIISQFLDPFYTDRPTLTLHKLLNTQL